MEIYVYTVEYRSTWDNDGEIRTHGAKISASGWWDAMQIVQARILPTLDAEKVYSIKLSQEDM